MKILIACDMEGISGVVDWNQVTPSHPEYQRFRHIMTADVNAAIAGAAEGGANQILVSDGHWNGTNILIEELDSRAQLNSGSPSRFSMVQGADSGVDAALFIGYHAMVGTLHAVLDHTWSNQRVANLWLNGRLTGEFGLNGALCGSFGVPVLMVSGDQSVCAEAREFAKGVLTAQVKEAAGRSAACCLPLAESQSLIKNTAAQAVSQFKQGKGTRPIQIAPPVNITIAFINTSMADQASIFPGSQRLDGTRVSAAAANMPDAYETFRTLVNMVSI